MSSHKDKVWNLAKPVAGKSPAKYRRDPAGTVVYYDSYGSATAMGWDIDHIKPVSRGGHDTVRNKQVLSTHINRSKGASLQKPSRHSKSNK